MKDIWISLKLLTSLIFLLGLAYPAIVTGVAKVAFPFRSEGSLMITNATLVGSELIGQQFSSDRYFVGRPSAIEYNPLPSGGSNLSVTSQALKDLVSKRAEKLSAPTEAIPQDLLFASASGLDPHISPSAAEFQTSRIAHARGISDETIKAFIRYNTELPQFGFLGEKRVNVLKLNLALDNIEKLQ